MLRCGVNTVIHGCNHQAFYLAAEILAEGGLVAFPTETVYGLGANAFNTEACKRIYMAKGRPSDNPLIVHIASLDDLPLLAMEPPLAAIKLAESFWPGPLTMVFRKTPAVSNAVSGGLPTVAVRFPAHNAALKLIKTAGFPLAAPSANASGRPSPTLASHVANDLGGKINMIIDGGPCTLGIESTIVDVTTNPPCLLRPGSITLKQLNQASKGIYADPSILGKALNIPPKAPGMKYTHYAPLATVTLFTGEPFAVAQHIAGLAACSPKKTGILATNQTYSFYDNNRFFVISSGDRRQPETIAAGLFAALRNFDLHGVDRVLAEGIPEDDAGLAVMNRLKKAAGFHIVCV